MFRPSSIINLVGKFLVLLFFLSSFVFGVSVFAWGTYRLHLSQKSLNWSIVDGKVISSDINQWTVLIGARGCCDDKERYSPIVRYSYQVQDQIYENDIISFDLAFPNKNYTDEKMRLYKQDSIVKIYFNPSNPIDSCLEPGLYNQNIWFPILIGLLFIIFSFFFIVFLGKEFLVSLRIYWRITVAH